jgi:ABC-type polysaccharide/polyol phosphate export permease
MFMLLPGLLIIAVNGVCYGMILAIFAARYRDISQIIASLMQVAFFLTPIMWDRTILPPRYRFVTDLNPFTHFLNLLRAPLMGSLPDEFSVSVTLLITAFGLLFAFYIFSKVRHRIIYWL